jgi:indolepyruvate ferredoxin oxidoreductase beta subunit
VVEIAGTLPAGLGRGLLRSPRLGAWLARWTAGKRIRTSTVSGFFLLYLLAGLRRWRRGSLRFQEENARIEDWLGRIQRYAGSHYALAVEIARAQRLVKGYGETHERGWRNFTTLMEQLDALAYREDGPEWMARLQSASLADEEGDTLRRALEELRAAPVTQARAHTAGA